MNNRKSIEKIVEIDDPAFKQTIIERIKLYQKRAEEIQKERDDGKYVNKDIFDGNLPLSCNIAYNIELTKELNTKKQKPKEKT